MSSVSFIRMGTAPRLNKTPTGKRSKSVASEGSGVGAASACVATCVAGADISMTGISTGVDELGRLGRSPKARAISRNAWRSISVRPGAVSASTGRDFTGVSGASFGLGVVSVIVPKPRKPSNVPPSPFSGVPDRVIARGPSALSRVSASLTNVARASRACRALLPLGQGVSSRLILSVARRGSSVSNRIVPERSLVQTKRTREDASLPFDFDGFEPVVVVSVISERRSLAALSG